MSEKFETRGEIGHALAGLRDQLALQAKVFAVAAGLSVVALGFLYNQYADTTLKFADVLASNALARALLTDWTRLPPRRRNYARWVILYVAQ